MGFDVGQFIAQSHGPARNNKFEVYFPMPNALVSAGNPDNINYVGNRVQMFIEETTLPGIALRTHDHRRFGYGPTEQRPYGAAFAPLPLQFRCDQGGQAFRYLASWARVACNYEFRDGMNKATGAATNGNQYPYEVAYKMDYAVDLEIVTYQDDGSESIHLILREAYPIYVGNEIGLNWRHKNGYIQIPVTMAYTDWKLARSTSLSVLGAGNSVGGTGSA